MRQRRYGFARALAAFALLAIVVRALVPAGYMVAPTQDGRLISIVLCSGHGPVAAMMDLDSGAIIEADKAPGSAPEQAPQADAPCVFATMAQLAAPDAGAAAVPAPRWAWAAHSPLSADAPSRRLAAPPPWATGPPSHA